MSYTIDLTESNVFQALRAFLIASLGTLVDPGNIIRLPNNRASLPKTFPYITLYPTLRSQIARPHDAISDPLYQPQSRAVNEPTDFSIQIDAFGPTAADLTQIIHTLFEAEDADTFFRGYSIQGVYPIYAEDPHQIPLVDGEAEYEERWVMQVHMQYNPTITAPVQTASTLTPALINVEATYQ